MTKKIILPSVVVLLFVAWLYGVLTKDTRSQQTSFNAEVQVAETLLEMQKWTTENADAAATTALQLERLSNKPWRDSDYEQVAKGQQLQIKIYGRLLERSNHDLEVAKRLGDLITLPNGNTIKRR